MKQSRLHVEFLSTPRSSSGYAKGIENRRRDSSLFWWTVAITLLLGVATFSWFFSIYVFAHPEKPFNYRLLTRFEKLAPPERFSALAVPTGAFIESKEGYGRYFSLSEKHLAVDNALLKRRYLTNYEEESPVYMKGKFRITDVRPLTETDAFTAGFVAKAKSHDYPNVVIEYLFPMSAAPANPAEIFARGDDLTLDRSSTFASVIHVAKLEDEIVSFTLVPLVYGTYEVSGVGNIALSPPSQLNMKAPWPIMDSQPPQQVDQPIPSSDPPAKMAGTGA